MAKDSLKIAALEATITEQDAEIEMLKAQIAAGISTPSVKAQVLEVPAQAFEVNGNEYQFVTAQFSHRGILYASKAALKNPELLAELVAWEVGIIKKIC